jgi:hypothetical protein
MELAVKMWLTVGPPAGMSLRLIELAMKIWLTWWDRLDVFGVQTFLRKHKKFPEESA